jgi:hypothetical protein
MKSEVVYTEMLDILARQASTIPTSLIRDAFDHRHHKISNTGTHSVLVALESVKIGKLFKLDQSRLEQLVQAALWHDIGIINTYDVYSNWHERNRRHPERSCEFYKKHISDFDQHVHDMIATHMWPFGIKNVPRTLDAWILNIADDIVSVKDRFRLESAFELCVVADVKSKFLGSVNSKKTVVFDTMLQSE